ncbi:MAG: alpha/beta hydrolase [Rhizobiales bacterium]|nr:alpha/beta hydrolase [Hyphomicrobiales bacterium]
MAEKDPDVAAFWAWCKERAAKRGNMTLAETRESFDAEMARIPLADNVTTESLSFGSVPVEKITPATATPGKVLLYLHGGGHVFGSIKSHRHFVSRLAVATKATAYHIDYRLAPEHPYPAAIEDALVAYRAILDSGIAPADLIVGGESAGGNLAAALLLKLKDEKLPQPAGLYLLSPWLDMTTAAESYEKVGARDPMITREGIVGVALAYLGNQPDNPLASPVRADVAGLPPMLIQVGSEEVLLSDSTTFANNAAMTGIDVSLRVWAGMPHAWPLFHPFLRAGLPAIDEVGAWMRKRLGII